MWALILLPPATKLRQGNVFTPVCQSFSLRGRVSPTLPNPWADTPPSRHPLGRPPLPSACWDTHPPGQTLPWVDTPAQCMLGYTPPCPVHVGIHPPVQCMLGYTPRAVHAGIHPPCSAYWDTVNKRAARILLECILVFVLNFSHFF